MLIRKHIGSAALIAGILGVFVLTGVGQQKGGTPTALPSIQQVLANAAQQQAQFSQLSQSPSSPLARPSPGNGPASAIPSGDSSPYLQEQARLKRNDERQRKLESDAARLLALANLLKTEVGLSGSESMTPEMLRQMDEIEKLARSVKERMRS